MINQLGNALFAIGISYLIALFIGRLASRIRLPKVTGYLIVGLLVGPSLAEIIGYEGLIEWETLESIQILSELALALIMVIIGGQFKFEALRRWGSRLAKLSASEIGATFFGVAIAIFLLNYFLLKLEFGSTSGLLWSSFTIALFTGIIAIAGAPAATLLVIREYESQGPVTDLVLSLLGLNNLVPIVLFNLCSFLLLNSDSTLWGFLYSLFSPLLLGLVGGVLISIWAQKLTSRVELLLLLMGVIVANIGAAHLWNIDFYLSCLITGMIIVNASPKANQLFQAVKGVDYPLYVMFFIIAGASLHFEALGHIGLLGIAYIVMRSIGKIYGSWIGARMAGFGRIEREWIGLALLAQAGVAIGLAQSLAVMWPDGGAMVQTIVLGSVVLFEIVGPITVRQALVRTGEVPVLTLYAKSSPETALEGLHHVVECFRHSMGVPSGHNIESAADILVQHVMRRNVETIREDMPFNEILKFISHSKYDLVDDMLKNLVVASDLLKPEPLTITPERKLKEVLEIFQKHSDISYLPVVTGEDKKKLAGMVSQNDILAAFRSSTSA